MLRWTSIGVKGKWWGPDFGAASTSVHNILTRFCVCVCACVYVRVRVLVSFFQLCCEGKRFAHGLGDGQVAWDAHEEDWVRSHTENSRSWTQFLTYLRKELWRRRGTGRWLDMKMRRRVRSRFKMSQWIWQIQCIRSVLWNRQSSRKSSKILSLVLRFVRNFFPNKLLSINLIKNWCAAWGQTFALGRMLLYFGKQALQHNNLTSCDQDSKASQTICVNWQPHTHTPTRPHTKRNLKTLVSHDDESLLHISVTEQHPAARYDYCLWREFWTHWCTNISCLFFSPDVYFMLQVEF